MGRWRWRASVVARGVGFVQIDVADMAVFVVTEVLAVVLGVGSGHADKVGIGEFH